MATKTVAGEKPDPTQTGLSLLGKTIALYATAAEQMNEHVDQHDALLLLFRQAEEKLMQEALSVRQLAQPEPGTLDDMPRDLVHQVSGDLIDVVTLLRVLRESVPASSGGPDGDNLTDSASRSVALASMADEKVRKIIKDIDPYV